MQDPLIPGKFYHVYSRTVGEEILFRNENNYLYFLRRYSDFCSNHFATFCFCLLPNHFHFLIQVRESTNEAAALSAFSNFLNSYTKSYNKVFDRHGGLFQRKFKRKTAAVTDVRNPRQSIIKVYKFGTITIKLEYNTKTTVLIIIFQSILLYGVFKYQILLWWLILDQNNFYHVDIFF